MKRLKQLFLPLCLLSAFGLGFTTHHLITAQNESITEGRVTGIGGIFFKAENPDSLKKWYSSLLGINTDKYGTVFVWYQGADSTRHGYTQWGVFKSTTKYFNPSKKEYMINYRVDNLDMMLKRFRENKVTICDTIESYDYGKFLHIMDPEGNKIELWEPIDEVYGKIEGATTK